MWMKRLTVLNQVIILLGWGTQLLTSIGSEPPTKRRVAESLLSWSLPLNLGVLETYYFVRHVARRGIGQSAEERLLAQVAIAHLAFGVLGLLSVRFRGMFWFATIVGQAVFLGGVTALNDRENPKDEILLFDVLVSLAHLVLLRAYDPLEATRPRRGRRRFGVSS